MAKYSNEIVYDIKTNLDASGISKLQSELTKLKQTLDSSGTSKFGLQTNEIQKSIVEVNKLQAAITKAFDPKIGMLDLSKFNKILEQEHISLNKIHQDWSKMGVTGVQTINSLVTSITTLNKQTNTVNVALSKMVTTFGNTVRWGITAGLLQEMMGSISNSVRYMKDLDESLTQIQMVTSNSVKDMRELVQYANQAAQALATTTVDYTNAIKVFSQEGFSLPEAKIQAELAVTLANVSEQDTATTADQITAYRNAFGLSIEEMSQSLDKLANVANNTAANVGELMTAAQRSASVAASVGASEDVFLASISTIQSVTRQSAEEIGNGLKTIMQRFADIRAGGSSSEGGDSVDYGEYAQALKKVGVDVLDATGEFKGFDQIIRELQTVWGDLSETMKVAVGEKVAGKFQYNRFAALMNNPEYFNKAYAMTQDAEGTMDIMQQEYADSIEGRLKTLQAAGEQVISTMFNQDVIEPVLDDITEFVNNLNTLVEVAGGAEGVFEALGAILLKTFSTQIGNQIQGIATNIQTIFVASNNSKNMQDTFNKLGINANAAQTTQTSAYAGQIIGSYNNLDTQMQEKISTGLQQMGEFETQYVELKGKERLLQQETNNYLIEARLLISEEINSLREKINAKEGELKLIDQGSKEGQKEAERLRFQIQAYKERRNILLGIEVKERNIFELSEKELSILKSISPEYAKAYDLLNKIKQEFDSVHLSLIKSAQLMKSLLSQSHIATIGKGFSSLSSSIMSTIFALTSFKSITEIINDDTKTMKEKLDESLISLMMLGTMGASALDGLVTAYKSITDGIKGLIAAKRTQLALNSLEIIQNTQQNSADEKKLAMLVAEKYEALSVTDQNKALALARKVAGEGASEHEREILRELIGLKAEGAELTDNEKKLVEKAVAQRLVAKELGLGTVKTLIYTAALKLSGKAAIDSSGKVTAFGIAVKAALPNVALITVITAAIVGLAVGLKALYDDFNKDAIAAQAMAKKADYAAKKMKETQDVYNTLLDDFSKYQELKDSLDDLTTGTDEWREALQKVNDQVIELLDKYPDLAQYISMTKNGEMVISEEGLDAVQKAQENALEQARVTRLATSAASDRAAKQSAATDTRRNITWVEGETIVELSDKDFSALTNLIQQQGSDALNSVSTLATALNTTEENPMIAAIKQNAGNIEQYIALANQLDASNAAKLQGICGDILAKIPGENRVDAPEEGYALELYQLEESRALKELQAQDRDTVAKRYAEEVLGSDTAYANRQYKDGDWNPFTENGADTFTLNGIDYRLDYMESVLAAKDAAEAIKQAGENIVQMSEIFAQTSAATINGLGNTIGQSILSGNNGTGADKREYDFSSMDYNQMSGLNNYLGNLEGEDLVNALGVTEEQAQAKGYQDAIAYAEAYKEALNTEMSNIDFNDPQSQQDFLSRSSSLEVFDDRAFSISQNSQNGLDLGVYAQGLQTLGSQYGSASEETANYKNAVDELATAKWVLEEAERSGTEQQVKDAQNRVANAEAAYKEAESLERLAIRAGELGKEYNLSTKEIEDYAKKLKESGEYIRANGEELAEMAKDQRRYDRALANSTNNISKWRNSLEKAIDGEEISTETLNEMGEAYGDLLDIDGTSLSKEFKSNAENLELMQKALDGDEEAYKQLQKAAAKDILAHIGIDTSKYETDLAIVESMAATANGEKLADIEAGASLDNTAYLQALTDMVNAAGMTADQATDYLSNMGIDAEVETESQQGEPEIVGYNTVGHWQPSTATAFVQSGEGSKEINLIGQSWVYDEPKPITVPGKTTTGMALRVTSANKSSGGGMKFSNRSSGGASSGSQSSSGGGGGGGGSKAKKKRTEKADKNKRDPFIEIQNAIDRQTTELEKQEEFDNELYGSNKIKNLDKIIQSHQKLAELYKEEAKIQKQQIEMQKNQNADEYGNLTVKGLADKVGMTVEYNIDGDIINGKAIQDALYARYKSAYDEETYHSDEDDYSSYTENTEYWKDLYDQWVSIESEFGDMLDNLDDINASIRAEIDSIQESNDSIVDELHSMLEEWQKLSIDQHKFIQEMEEYRNGADIKEMFKPSLESAQKTFDEIMRWNGVDQNGNNVSLNNAEYNNYKNIIDNINSVRQDLIDTLYKDSEALIESFNPNTLGANGEYDWSTTDSIWADRNLTGIRDAILEGNSENAQRAYDEVYRSINENRDLDTKRREEELNKFNEYIDTLKKSMNDINIKTQEAINSQTTIYTSLTGGSIWSTMMDQINARLKDAQAAFGYNANTKQFEAEISDFTRDENGNLVFSDFTQQAAYDNLKESLETGEDTINNLIDAITQEEEIISNGIDEMSNLIDRQIQAYEDIADRLESISDINDLVYGSSNIGLENKISIDDASIEALSGKIATISNGIINNEAIVSQFEKIAKANGLSLEQLKTSNIISKAESEALQTAQDNITSLQQEQMDTEAELLETIVSRLETQGMKEAQNLANSLLGGDVSWMQEQWEMRQRNEELYLDDMNRAYNIQKLQYSYQEMLNDSANQNSLIQQKITLHMEDQLEYLRNKEKLSQNDIDYANARLEILKKQIALEDAQSNKTQMRLQRDSSGNYSYVYTANEDDLVSKQQELLDAQINAYNIAKEGLLEAEQGTIDEIANMQDTIVSIMTDASLTVEERKDRIQEVMTSLGEYTSARTEQIKIYSLETLQSVAASEEQISQKNISNLQEIYDTMEESLTAGLSLIDERFDLFATNTGQNLGEIEEGVTSLGESMLSVSNGVANSYINTLDDFTTKVGSKDDSTSFIGKIYNYLDIFKDSSNTALESISSTINTLDSDFNVLQSLILDCDKAIKDLNSNTGEFADNLNALVEQINEAVTSIHGDNGKNGMRNALIEVQEEFSKLYTSAMDWLTAINAKVGQTTTSIKGIGDAIAEVNTKTEVIPNDKNKEPVASVPSKPTGPSWDNIYAVYDAINRGIAGNGIDSRISWAKGKGYSEEEARLGQQLINYIYSGYSLSSAKQMMGFYTGGYTGTWYGNTFDEKSGKLAILHQKELVLNQEDTKNLLDVIRQVRQMQNIALNNNLNLSRLIFKSNNDTIEQRVEITAEFPNVTTANEIEAALLNLSDMAYQSAYRTY